MDCATPGRMAPEGKKAKQVEKVVDETPGSSLLLGVLLQFLPPGFCPDFPG